MRISQDSRFALIDALNAEWSELGQDHALAGYGRAEICRWAAEHPALADCRNGTDVLAAIRARPDPVLGSLIGIHQHATKHCRASRPEPQRTSHQFAGRIVLQTMLGKLVTMAAADRRHGVEDYVGHLWARIGSYPLQARPRRIAANLALDTLKAVTREDRRPTGIAEPVPVLTEALERIGLDRAAVDAADDPIADLTAHRVLRTAATLGLIDEPTRRLLQTVYADGLTSAEAAARHGLTPATVRFRCSRAVRRLAKHATEIADAA
jgi:DNA-directed RNA polymerase specialized sigma24 family protein